VQRKAATKSNAGGGCRDARVRRGSEYDAFYRLLDLPPGAPLAAIEDAARLQRAAFQPDGLPGHLRPQTEARAQAVARALGELRYFWKSYRNAPPSADLAGAAGLLDALVEALDDSGTAVATTQTRRPARPAAMVPEDAAAPADPPVVRRPQPVAGAVLRLPPPRRLHHIELAAVLHGNEVFTVGQPAVRAMLPAPPAPPPVAAPGRAALGLPGRVAAPPPPAAAPAPPRAIMRPAMRPMPRLQLTLPVLRGTAVKVGALGLAIALSALLQHYALPFLAPDAAIHAPPPAAAASQPAPAAPK
jgi:hypothetical protein